MCGVCMSAFAFEQLRVRGLPCEGGCGRTVVDLRNRAQKILACCARCRRAARARRRAQQSDRRRRHEACIACGAPLLAGRRHRQYCSGRCRTRAHRARHVGGTSIVPSPAENLPDHFQDVGGRPVTFVACPRRVNALGAGTATAGDRRASGKDVRTQLLLSHANRTVRAGIGCTAGLIEHRHSRTLEWCDRRGVQAGGCGVGRSSLSSASGGQRSSPLRNRPIGRRRRTVTP